MNFDHTNENNSLDPLIRRLPLPSLHHLRETLHASPLQTYLLARPHGRISKRSSRRCLPLGLWGLLGRRVYMHSVPEDVGSHCSRWMYKPGSVLLWAANT